MENLSEEEKKRIEANKMFDLAEKCIMEYLCLYMKLTPSELYINNTEGMLSSEPLILYPIKEYSDEYLSFSLEVVPHDYQLTLPEQLQNDSNINNALGFIYHAISQVFNAVVNHSILEDKCKDILNASIHMEYDDKSFTFYPFYIFPQRRQELIFLQFKEDLDKIKEPNEYGQIPWDSLKEETKDEWEMRYAQIKNIISNIKYDENIANETEKAANDEIQQLDRIGIIFNEIVYDQLFKKTDELSLDSIQEEDHEEEDHEEEDHEEEDHEEKEEIEKINNIINQASINSSGSD
jgi:hypothetical protein